MSSYSAVRFIKLFRLPFFPTGYYRILDECPHCGVRGTTSAHRYAKERKRHLAQMVKSFTNEDKAENPETCCHALQTLMVYDDANWFKDVQKSYGLRFDTNEKVQHIIARGLCRFGDYEQAAIQCRKALVLGAGKETEELLNFCLTLQEADYQKRQIENLKPAPESCIKAFIPLGVIIVLLAAGLISFAVSSMQTYRAWVVNGSLQTYQCTIDDETIVLNDGDRQEVKLSLGENSFQMKGGPRETFTYDVPFFKQLFARQLLVINPDAMALIEVAAPVEDDGSQEEKRYLYGQTVHLVDGVGLPWFGFKKEEEEAEASRRILLYRPSTHQAMIERLMKLDRPEDAVDYARKALLMQPATPEAPSLFDIALGNASDEFKAEFLRKGLKDGTVRLNWHIRYQDHLLATQPDYPLIQEYTRLCKEQPDNGVLYYLLARLLPDRTQAHQFLKHAERSDQINGLGYYAMARDHFYDGRYAEAQETVKKAMEEDPLRPEFLSLYQQSLLAQRNFDELLNHEKLLEMQHPELHDPFKKILYLTLAGYHQEAEAEALNHSKAGTASLPMLNSVRYYAVGNLDYYFECIRDAGVPNADLQELLHKDRLDEAHQLLLQENSAWTYTDHLLLYSGAMRAGKTEIAEKQLERALRSPLMPESAAVLFKREEAPSVRAILRLDRPLPEQAVLLTALGFRFPEKQVVFHGQARVCNIVPSYPQLLIRKYTSRVSVQ